VKRSFKACLLITGTLALASFGISVSLVRDLLGKTPVDKAPAKLRYHFALYIAENHNSSLDELVDGARRSAAENGVALSVHNLDAEGAALHIATYLGTDGLIVCPNADDAVTLDRLTELRADKIPVVLVNHNVTADQPWPGVGTNKFDLGKKAGNLVGLDNGDTIRLSVIYSEKSAAIYAERELVEMGITAALGKRLVSTISSLHTDLNPRDAEKIVYTLVRSDPKINTIVFTDAQDTIAGTQALIDLNLVGRIQIVGSGSDPAILDYIQKGIIVGSLVIKPDLVGYQAVKSLAELCASGYTSQSVDIGIDVINRENLFQYRYTKGKKSQTEPFGP
jgi:ribose transport system substrate-binding protein